MGIRKVKKLELSALACNTLPAVVQSTSCNASVFNKCHITSTVQHSLKYCNADSNMNLLLGIIQESVKLQTVRQPHYLSQYSPLHTADSYGCLSLFTALLWKKSVSVQAGCSLYGLQIGDDAECI